MKMKPLYLFVCMAAACATIGCSGWDDNYGNVEFKGVANASLEVGQGELSYDEKSSSQPLTIMCQGAWKAVSSASWLTLSATQGWGDATIDVQVEANNNTVQARIATITVTNGIGSRIVNVTQNHLTELLHVVQVELVYGFQGGTDNVVVEANASWTVSSSASWLTVVRNQDQNSFTVTTQQNIGTENRQAVITVKGVTLSHSISVFQWGVQRPGVGSLSISGITKHTANCRMEASSADVEISEYGICYSSTASVPNVDNADVMKQGGGGHNVSHVFNLTGLRSKTTYYVRAYIVTPLGLLYGETIEFTTLVSAPEESDNGTPKEN